LKHWISENYNELKNICSKFSTQEEVDDLLHLCLEEFMNNKRVEEIPDKEKIYFFTKIVRNQYNSESSKYHYTYRKYKFNEYNINEEQSDIPYEESQINMDWIDKELNNMDWYYKKLFKLFIEENCSISKLSLRTTIPLNSISRDINKVRRELIKRRTKFLK
jgi:hypothetical protein